MALKKAWITPFATNDDLFSLTLESKNVDPDYRKISIDERVFPDRENKDKKRHTIVIGLFTQEDLEEIMRVIHQFQKENRP